MPRFGYWNVWKAAVQRVFHPGFLFSWAHLLFRLFISLNVCLFRLYEGPNKTRRLLGNPAGLFSITKFEADLKSQGIAVGRETLYQLLDHLEDAFLLHAVPIATDSEKRRQVNPRKIYPIDPAMGPVFDRGQKQNMGHALEVAAKILPADQLLLLTAESRLPFPSVPTSIEILPAWQWMLSP